MVVSYAAVGVVPRVDNGDSYVRLSPVAGGVMLNVYCPVSQSPVLGEAVDDAMPRPAQAQQAV